MLVAESSDLIYKTIRDDAQTGGLPYNFGSFYNEYQILNNLGSYINILDFKNEAMLIQHEQDSDKLELSRRDITIRCRQVSGPRSWNMANNTETTRSKWKIITIPYAVFIKEPVFVEEINVVLFCKDWHNGEILHPYSRAARDAEIELIREQYGEAEKFCPISIVAYDSTKYFKVLYTIINGAIYPIPVSDSGSEDDSVVVTTKSTDNKGDIIIHSIRTTFSEMLKASRCYWELGGFQISSTKRILKDKLDYPQPEPVKVDETRNMIYEDDIVEYVESIRKKDTDRILELENVVQELEQNYNELKKRSQRTTETVSNLLSGDYVEKHTETIHKKLDLEFEKIQVTKEQIRRDESVEKLKHTKEQFNLVSTILKSLVVFVPLGIKLYMDYKKSRS